MEWSPIPDGLLPNNFKDNKALASLQLLTNHPAGIGDHSTKDYWDNCNEAIRLLASADERLETLEKYFTPKDATQ